MFNISYDIVFACSGGRCASEREGLRRAAAAAPAAPARLGELITWGALPQRCREGARTVRAPASVILNPA